MRLLEQNHRTRSIWDDMNALSREIWGGLENARDLSPRTDVVEKADVYEMHVELPGLQEKDLEIKVKEGVLTLATSEAEETEKKVEEEVKYLLRERREFSFQRSFRLPKDVQEDGIQAKFERGVLTVTLPRRPEAQPRVIAIKAE